MNHPCLVPVQESKHAYRNCDATETFAFTYEDSTSPCVFWACAEHEDATLARGMVRREETREEFAAKLADHDATRDAMMMTETRASVWVERMLAIGMDPDLVRVMQTDPLLLNDEFLEWAPAHSYWIERLAEAERKEATESACVEQTRARLYLFHRTALITSHQKVTEEHLKALVEVDAEMAEARRAYIDARAESRRMKGHMESLSGKKAMLMMMGAHVRAEMQGDPSIRSEHRNFRAHQNGRDVPNL